MLEGKLVRLRAQEPSDLERDHAWINDREVIRHLAARYPMSLTEEERWLKERPADSFASGLRLAIDTKEGVHIGNIDLHAARPEDWHAGLGIMIGDKDYWSQGYGTDAIVTLLRFGFHEMNLNKVWLTVFEQNARAIACYKKCGFTEAGRLRHDRYLEGRYWDSLYMEVLRDEFDGLHGDVAAEEGGP